jgi:hypothetical protein
MAAQPVTAEEYPELTTFDLNAKGSTVSKFLGRVIESGLPCVGCEVPDTVSVYRGPQNGLAMDKPEAPVEIELTWCTQHGQVTLRLVNADGSEYRGV